MLPCIVGVAPGFVIYAQYGANTQGIAPERNNLMDSGYRQEQFANAHRTVK
jgi:hypothetical protein